MRVDESFIKYLSGLLDADGNLSFGFVKSRDGRMYNLFLQLKLIASSNVDDRGFVASLPGRTGWGFIFQEIGPEGQTFTSWRVNKQAHLEMLVPRLIKHMVIKARHWQWLLEVWRERRRRPLGERSVLPDEKAELRRASEASRLNVGPLKPKNHPSWAWLAGYLDGDGTYSFDDPKHRPTTKVMRVFAIAHSKDASVLEFLQKAFGGGICKHSQCDGKMWYRNLGVSERSFALRFLPKVVRHARLKRHQIEKLIHYHRRQRLNEPTPAGEAIV